MQQQFAVRPSRGAILVVSALFASAPAALAGSSAWPLEAAPVLVLGASADTVQTEDEVSFDILAPAPAAMPTVTAPAAAVAQSGYDDNASGMFFRLGGGLMTATDSDGPDEDIEFDEGYIVDLAIGHRFAGQPNSLAFDLELEGVWTDQDTDDDDVVQAVRDVTVLGALVNGIADFRLAESFSIYGGAGIGAAFMDIGTESDAVNDFDDEDGPFLTWQGKAGLKFLTAGGSAIGFGYRFLNIDDVEIDDDLGGASFDLSTEQHALELSYTFGVAAGY
jgi:opacity protein-like surface antigen